MASSEPGRGKPSSDSDKSENPFIRFKRFTDAKVSTILQGILGLPSAFSNGNDATTRWAGLDDDLKRRDELRSRQKALSNSESRRLHDETDGVEAPAKKLSGSPTPQDNSSTKNAVMDDEEELRDVELYSPVTISLFAHLNRRPEDDNTEWKSPSSTSSGFAWAILGTCWPGNIYRLHEDQVCQNPLRMIQAMTFNTLSRTANRPECRWFHSDQSVLPYILFSPYSPLALSFQPAAVPAPVPADSSYSNDHRSEELQWCNAFEDLLLVSSGREMMPIETLPPRIRDTRKFGECSTAWPNGQVTTLYDKKLASCGMTWINGLQTQGLLEHNLFNRPPLSATGLLISLLSPLLAISKNTQDSEDGAPQTEEEMYDRFFGSKSTSSNTKNFNGKTTSSFVDITSILEKMHDEVEVDAFERFLAEVETWNGQKFDPASSPDKKAESASEAPKPFSFESFLRGHPPTQRSAATQTDVDSKVDQRSDEGRNSASEESLGDEWLLAQQNKYRLHFERQGESPINGASGDVSNTNSDRVISTITSTEQSTDVDGTKTTTVSVTKYFANGRSVTTETSHYETPGFEELKQGLPQNPIKDDEQQGVDKSAMKAKNNEVNGKEKGKGWFWN